MPKFFIKTYGCQMNERDSEQVAHSLLTRGYERVAHEAEADVVLLNTCSVRDMADQKALGKMGMLGRMAKERPHVVFGFLGCMAQARGESLLKNLPHVVLVVGTQKFHRVADYVEELVAKKRACLAGITDPGYSRMDDLRFSIVDVAEEAGSQSTIREQNSRRGRRPLLSRSCRDATCIAPFALSRRRVARSAAVQLTRLCAKCAISSQVV